MKHKWILGSIVLLVTTCPAIAGVVFESATMGPAASWGSGILGGGYWAAMLFSVSDTTHVTGVGGHMLTWEDSTQSFAAVILSAPNGFRLAQPATVFDPGPIVANATFALAKGDPEDVVVPLDVTLSPGQYALLFGGPAYGATGVGGMSLQDVPNPALPPMPLYFWTSSNNAWMADWTSGAPTRFVVYGEPAPEPASLALMCLGGLPLLRRGRRRPDRGICPQVAGTGSPSSLTGATAPRMRPGSSSSVPGTPASQRTSSSSCCPR